MAVQEEHDPLLRALARLDELDAAACLEPARRHLHAPSPANDLAGLIAAAERDRSAGARGPDFPGPRGTDSFEQRCADAERGNERIRAFVTLDLEAARAAAARLTGDEPLAGTVIAHKDLVMVRGQPLTAGSAVLEGLVADRDAPVVARLREAGAVSLGKLATHEFATGITGTVSAFHTPVNPRAPDRIPGGSSSGSAAAVAAGLVDLATGTDTGGSIRIPAACCGVVGYKPTRGLVPTDGVIPFSWTLDHVGPLGPSVEAVAAAAAVMSDPVATPGPHGSAGRVAFAPHLLEGCVAGVRETVQEAAERLEGAGYELHRVKLPALWEEIASIAAAIFLAEGAAYHAFGLRHHAQRYRPETRQLLARAKHVSGRHYVQARRLGVELTCAMEGALAGHDALLLPALPCLPPELHCTQVELPGGAVDVRAALTRFTRQSNVTGQPAIVLPCGRRGGLPVAVQLVGGLGRDAALLDVARELERAVGGAWGPVAPGSR